MPRVRMPLLLALALTLPLAACLPAPHRVYFAPRISGAVSRGGEPAAGVQLRLRASGTGQTAATVTDADGRFALGPLSGLALSTSLLHDSAYGFACTPPRIAIDSPDWMLAGVPSNLAKMNRCVIR